MAITEQEPYSAEHGRVDGAYGNTAYVMAWDGIMSRQWEVSLHVRDDDDVAVGVTLSPEEAIAYATMIFKAASYVLSANAKRGNS